MGEGVILEAVEAIYGAAPDPAAWPRALEAIANVFDDVGAVLMYGREDGGFGAISSKNLHPLLSEYEREFAGRDLRTLRGIERGVFLTHDAVTDRHVVSDNEIEHHAYYKMLARHGLKYFIGVPLAPDPSIKMALSVQRAIGREPYTDEELAIMTRLGHHAEKSLRLSIRLLDAELANLSLQDALARLSIGVVGLDSLKRVVFKNPTTDQILAGDALSLINNRLIVSDAAARAALSEAIDGMVDGDQLKQDPKPILIPRGDLGRPLAIYVLPVFPSSVTVAEFLTQTRVILLVMDPGANMPADPAIVRDVLGITLGEARVAALVGAGLSPRDTAEKLGITEESTRTALKRVFSKAGISRQSELAVLLSKLALR